ncbi:hypothetical protein EPUS_07174 [Endocarpon pusillum Z07020]|uniref:Heterokaryon incompatibility domain-containing protein n=1 Tax=Endocarpon pusillum (strain Z07020 / HMAS-L-300199) TaxID=1263415 RepID=U1G9E7_ENDPU|nr:uncharacterized protein EPUS_07174 [Endocarpon pusillum Z07020]ERF68613.1 hypothetical protein EPUS_07174 [Endocarpon pusillum Z07020]
MQKLDTIHELSVESGEVAKAGSMRQWVVQILAGDVSETSDLHPQRCHYDWDEFTHHQDLSQQVIVIRRYTQQEHQLLVDAKCEELCNATTNPASHLTDLDRCFSSLLICKWSTVVMQLRQTIADEVCDYISRLPRVPTALPGDRGDLPSELFSGQEKAWDKLLVASQHSKNIVRCITLRVLYDHKICEWTDHFAQTVKNCVGELIDATVRQSRAAVCERDKQRWFIVRAYLWNFWQTCRTLYAALNFKSNFKHNQQYSQNLFYQWFRNFDVSTGTTLKELTKLSASKHKAASLCLWTLALLHSDPQCLGLDFDLVHERYRNVSGSALNRCSADGTRSCSGLHPNACLRYRGLKVKDQSMHDHTCSDQNAAERKLTWDKASYTSVDGPRAVSVAATDACSEKVKYCKASGRTIAISHVWSHGQGGRPHHGINLCLHQRYARIAQEFDCDSYWIDTVCIPEDHKLRKEAIGYINEVFYKSHAVLVCDKDLMNIDVSKPNVELYESIVCAVLFCDWNSRAWTVLEGLKGRKNIYILCMNNQVLEFKTLVQSLCDTGHLNILAFMSQLVHIVPCDSYDRNYSPSARELRAGQVVLEVGGSWLSHRPASRKGDDIVIWSLLPGHGTKALQNAVDFWRQQCRVHTGFLLSSAERLKQRGLTWAPKTPYAMSTANRKGKSQVFYRALSSQETCFASIDEQGITAEWYQYYFQEPETTLWRRLGFNDSKMTATQIELTTILRKFVRVGRYGCLLHPVNETFAHNENGLLTGEEAAMP